jgi:hypothetical protein
MLLFSVFWFVGVRRRLLFFVCCGGADFFVADSLACFCLSRGPRLRGDDI